MTSVSLQTIYHTIILVSPESLRAHVKIMLLAYNRIQWLYSPSFTLSISSLSPSQWYPFLYRTCFILLFIIVEVYIHYSKCFCHGILPVTIFPYSFSPTPYCSTAFSAFHCLLPTQTWWVLLLSSLYHSVFFSFLLLVFPNSSFIQNILYVCIYYHACIQLYVLYFGSITHIWEKTCKLCLF
jgi:hypothetical protein